MAVPKLSLELAPGSRLGTLAISEMIGSDLFDSIIVVVREQDGLLWIPEPSRRSNGEAEAEIRIVPCAEASRGMSFSLREGLKEALALQPDAVMIVLADQPFITSRLLSSLIASYKNEPDSDFVACAGRSNAMPPVLFSPSMFSALSGLEGDAGARKLLASPAYRGVLVEVASETMFTDVDTPFDLQEARRHWSETKGKGGHSDESDDFGGNEPNMQAIR
ncbi:nucleotidyltransferase family protein [Cohnella lupini]|uniref:Molybdenum cofactor cytidylyltransferase n=1 Tax=Cohnella lupini TaxID=1294267 RepID=A0A3D9IWU1_9BACL|nr:nucleotidyltransferase family protein [Cohnella lupini]RED65979.1 molybdenum cofactor cytidylyltransferase [Cohnella lupini]